jgi:signal transduction histidine kinase/CheY-like chemotaxis protein
MNLTQSGDRFRWLVIGPFLIVVVLLATLGMASAEILSAVRAYVGGESLWSKGQKDAVYHLMNYAESRHASDYQEFVAAIAVPLGDQTARIELERWAPDLAIARRGLLQGGNHADDLDAMIWLFRWFGRVPFMADAISIWTQADEQIAPLTALARQVNEEVLAGDPTPVRMHALLQELPEVNARLTLLEQRFSATLGEASREARWLVQLATLLLGLTLAGGAVVVSSRVLRGQSRSEQALRTSEERQLLALEASELCLWDFDVDSGAVYLSEGWSKQLGGPPEPTQTTVAALFDRVPDAERPALMDALVAALKDPQASYRVEHRVKRLDGEWIWNLSEGRVVERGVDGFAVRMIGTNRDISQRKQAELARRGLEAQLRESQKMEAIGTLAAGIAHDFNNILGAILGNLVLACEDIGAGHPALHSLEQVNRSALRARALVRQILAFGRRQPQALVNRSLGPLVRETVAMMRSSLPAGVSLEATLPDAPLNVMADATQIQQVLMNLCTNAWHALHGQAGQIVVGLEAFVLSVDAVQTPGGLPPGDYAHLWVRDNGSGMDLATRARIFEPFFTTKPVGEGTGLGLSVVHGIVAEHHGAINVDSALGRGSTVHMYFPVVDSHSSAPASEWGTLQPLQYQQHEGRGQHVLYVDDDEVMVLLVERMIRRLGYRVTCFQDPQQALAAIRDQPQTFDLVVSDLNMPGFSGLDLAREVVNIRADLSVVISSGHISEEQRAELLRAGVHHLIQKENMFEELGAVVHRLLQGTAS